MVNSNFLDKTKFFWTTQFFLNETKLFWTKIKRSPIFKTNARKRVTYKSILVEAMTRRLAVQKITLALYRWVGERAALLDGGAIVLNEIAAVLHVSITA